METSAARLDLPMILYLNRSDIVQSGGSTSQLYIDAVFHALSLHACNEVVQPLKPYLRVEGERSHVADRIIAMPAYLGGETPISGLKWVGSKHDNPSHLGLERASALIILNDPQTNYPIAVMEAGLISGMRTAAVTALAARYLAKKGFHHLTCIGCGFIAQMHLLTLLEQFSSITTVHLFDLNPDASEHLKAEIQKRFPSVAFCVMASAEEAVKAGEVVVASTVTESPYIQYEWLCKGTFLSNISIMDVYKDVFLEVDKVVVDDWDQCNREKKVINQLVLEGRFSRKQLYAELGEILIGSRSGRESDEEIILLNPMGIAIEDIACAQAIYRRALANDVGTWLSLY